MDVTEFHQEWLNVPWTPQKKKKTFIVERRYIGTSTLYPWEREWHTYRKYHTETDMMNGFWAAAKRSKNSRYRYERKWEYRIP